MADNTAEIRFGSWQSPHGNVRIEYPIEILDEIRLAVCSGIDRNPRRAMDSAGVLFGRRQSSVMSIAAWRPLPCEHSQGSALVLSEKDLRDLTALLHGAKNEPELHDLDVLGWFVSHAHGPLALTPDDLHIFDLCFPAPGQFALVLWPRRMGPATGAFFVRDAKGELMDRRGSAGLILQWPANARSYDSSVHVPPMRARMQATQLGLNQPDPMPLSVPHLRRLRVSWLAWLWTVPVLAILIFAGLLSRERHPADQPPPALGLRLEEAGASQLQIDWDRNAQAIRDAKRAFINFDDGGHQQTVDLDTQQLRNGTFTYGRHSGAVKVKLAVFNENIGSPAVEESTQFVGSAPVPVAGAPEQEWKQEKAELEAEIRRLRARLADESVKTRDLQNLVRILEQQQGISRHK